MYQYLVGLTRVVFDPLCDVFSSQANNQGTDWHIEHILISPEL